MLNGLNSEIWNDAGFIELNSSEKLSIIWALCFQDKDGFIRVSDCDVGKSALIRGAKFLKWEVKGDCINIPFTELRCTKCKLIKRETEFHIKDKNKGIRRSRCTSCVAHSMQVRYSTNKPYALRVNIRSRLRAFMKSQGISRKVGEIEKLVGCNKDELRDYLTSRFVDGMNWGNYGKWHLDHIRPLISFDLTKDSQMREANHFTNLQPLWAEDNYKKGDTYNA